MRVLGNDGLDHPSAHDHAPSIRHGAIAGVFRVGELDREPETDDTSRHTRAPARRPSAMRPSTAALIPANPGASATTGSLASSPAASSPRRASRT